MGSIAPAMARRARLPQLLYNARSRPRIRISRCEAKRTLYTFLTPSRPALLALQQKPPPPSASPHPSHPLLLHQSPGFLQTAESDLLPLRPSSHPALRALALRFAPRNTTNRMTHLKRKRRFGFLARVRTRAGRKVLKRRRAKGRKDLSH